MALRRKLVPRRTAVAAMAGVAMLGTLAAPAGATHGAATLVAGSQPTLGLGQTNQLAGLLTLTPGTLTNTFAAGEQVIIDLDDSDVGVNCAAATDYVAFASVPTVTVTGTATLSASIVAPVPASACSVAVPVRNDRLIITVLGAGTGVITIANVRYDIGAGAALGAVKVTSPDVTLVTTGASNAFLTSVLFVANTPPVGLPVGSANQPVSNLVLTEQVVDAGGGSLCVQLGGGDTFDAAVPAPTVSVVPGAGGTDTAAVALASANTAIQVTITDSGTDTGPSTFTVAGLRLSSASLNNAGHVTATLQGGLCGAPTSTLSAVTVVAGVVTTNRFGGADRFTTAQILFEGAFPCAGTGLADAIIARADDFPDALAASYLAGKLGTGILLVDRDSATLPAATVNALRNRGVDKVTIIGGTTAVPAALATALDALPNVTCAGATQAAPNDTIAVERIDGADRYATARNVAERPGLAAAGTADYDGTPADPDGPSCLARKTAILATGTNFPDALVAGPVAYNGHNLGSVPPAPLPVPPACGDGQGFPVILTPSTALDPQAAAALTNLGIQQVLVMGGNTAIDPAVVTAVQAINSITVRRFAGTNRLDTARLFAEFAVNFLGYDRTAVAVARGDGFPDALAGGPFAGVMPAKAIVLTESPTSAGAETLAFFRARQGTSGVYGAPTPLTPIAAVDVFGGTGAITDATVSSILGAVSQA